MLESTFDKQDRFRSEVKDTKPEDLEEVNMGTEESPRKVYIGKALSPDVRRAMIDVLRKYRNFFAWSYDDLKAYRSDLFQHVIPLKEGIKPFRQK
jgi:hypothetical protein